MNEGAPHPGADVDGRLWATLPSWAAAVVAVLAATSEVMTPDLRYGSWAEVATHVAPKAFLLASCVAVGVVLDHRWPSPAALGLVGSDVPPDDQARRRAVAAKGFRAAWVAFGVLTMMGIARTDGDPFPVGASPWMVVVVVLVRWPVGVVAQQVVFFGWLQPRLGVRGPVLAAAAFALYHVGMDVSPSLLYVAPLAAVFALLRWVRGNVRAGITAHYALNVGILLLALGHRG